MTATYLLRYFPFLTDFVYLFIFYLFTYLFIWGGTLGQPMAYLIYI